jgi:VWFA-related protein
VDVVVLDRDARPVRGLTKADFTVLEDGQPQEVVSFEAREIQSEPALPQEAVAEPVVSNHGSPGSGRVLALVLDDLGIAPLGMTDVKKAAAQWLRDQAEARDEITLVTTSGDAWWSDRIGRGRADFLSVLDRIKSRKQAAGSTSEQMSDWEAHRIDQEWDGEVSNRVVDRWLAAGVCLMTFDAETSRRLCRQRVVGLARQMQGFIAVHSRAVFDTIEQVSRGLAGGRGRKSIVLFSEGFVRDQGDRREAAAIDAVRRANAAVYFVDSRGLIGLIGAYQAAASGPPPEAKDVGVSIFEETTLATGGSENLALETGGFAVTNNNDLNAGLVRVANESAAYYLLGYQPSKPASEKWRKLQVRVDRPGVKVRARQGYFPTLPPAPPVARTKKGDDREPPKASQAPLDPALLTGEEGAIPLRLATYVSDAATPALARVRVALEVGAASFVVSDTEDGGKVTFDLMLLGASRDQRVVYPIHERIEATLRGKESRPEWWTFTRELQLPAGVSQLRALVRDVSTGRTGTVAQRFEVPALDGFRLSTPILSDRVEASVAGGQGTTLLVAHREFRREGYLHGQYEVFGAGPTPVQAGYSLRAADGSLVREEAATPIDPGPSGRLVRNLSLPLDGLPEGSYELQIHVDKGPGTPALEAREPFALAGGESRPTVAAKAEEPPTPPVDPRLIPILEKAGRYVLEFERQFRDLSVEEGYHQWLTEPNGVTQRVTRSDLVYVAMPGPFAFTCFRDVVEADGKAIPGRASRLATLFLRESGATAIEKANKILAESAAYNIGARRTINVPTLALSLLRPDNQRHFRFRLRGKARRSGREAVEVEFEYASRTALVSRANQEGLPAEGRYVIDPADGTVLATELVLRFPGSSASARINVTYVLDPGLKVFVPAEMKERYADSGVLLTPDDIYTSQKGSLTPRVFGGVTQTEARYSNYRRFTVTTNESATLPSPP